MLDNSDVDRILSGQREAAPASPHLRDSADLIFVPWILNRPIPQEAVADLETCIAHQCDNDNDISLHSYGMGVRALNMAGRSIPANFRLPEHSFTAAELVSWIKERNWQQPWKASIEVLHALMPRLHEKPDEAQGLFDALECFQDEQGGWGQDTFHARMAAAFHFVPLYRCVNRPFPRLENLVRDILVNEPASAGFGAMDALYLLWYATRCGVLSSTAINIADYQALVVRDYEDRHGYIASAQLLSLLGDLVGSPCGRNAWDPKLWRR